jgi:hypothetical protein
VFLSCGALQLDFTLASLVGQLLTQHRDELDHEAELMGGALESLRDQVAIHICLLHCS